MRKGILSTIRVDEEDVKGESGDGTRVSTTRTGAALMQWAENEENLTSGSSTNFRNSTFGIT